MTVAGLVLAGGASSRFGSDKLSAQHRGQPVLHHALAAVAAVSDPVIVVLAPDAPLPVLPGGLAARIVITRDAVAHEGPLAGLAGGLAMLPPEVDRVIVAGGDMPSLAPGVLHALLAALDDVAGPAAVCLEAERVAPLPLALRPSAAAVANGVLADGRRSLRAFLDAVDAAMLPATVWRALDPDGDTLRDIDTREDLGAD